MPIVLYADDDEDLIYLAAKGLTLLGYKVVTVTSGLDMIKLVKRGRFDFVIIDIFIPGSSGIDLAWQCLQFDPDLHVLLVSGAIRSIDLEKCGILGITLLLKKQDPNTFVRDLDAWMKSKFPGKDTA